MVTTHKSASARGVVDPVCDMTIDPADAVAHTDYKGQTYYFCSDSCLERFRANPAPFLEADGEISPAAAGPAVETDHTSPWIRRSGRRERVPVRNGYSKCRILYRGFAFLTHEYKSFKYSYLQLAEREGFGLSGILWIL